MSGSPITRIALDVVSPVPNTRWCFITVECADGAVGIGEATLQAQEAALLDLAKATLPGLIGSAADTAGIARQKPADLPHAALASALSHAFWDIAATRQGVPLCEALGPVARREIPVYANFNRRTRNRTQEGFAASAGDALAAGFDAFKLAPFDEVTPEARKAGDEHTAMQTGLARVAAVRERIGPERALMVDCHWRFTPVGAAAALDALRPLGLHWFECPIPETDEMIPEIVRLRGQANAAGTLLAGCEHEIGVAGFERFVAAGAYDVVMPDIKYVGSIDEMLALGRRLEGAGTVFSPHNPSGPVCHAASLHVCAVAPELARLEMQFDETPVFPNLVGGALPVPRGGVSALPFGAGLGVKLDPAVRDEYRVVSLSFG